MAQQLITIPFVIANGAALSQIADLREFAIKGFAFPAAWTAAALTFLSSPDDPAAGRGAGMGTGAPLPMQSVRDKAGAEISYTVAAGQMFLAGASSAELDGLGFTQLQSGPAAAPVNQGAQRIIRAICAPRPV